MVKRNRQTNRYTLWQNIIATFKIYWSINKFNVVFYLFLVLIQVLASILSIFFASRIIGQLATFIQSGQIQLNSVYLLVFLSGLSIFAERFAWRWLSFIERKDWINWYQYMSVRYNAALASLDMEQHHDYELEKVLTKLDQQYQYTPQNYANTILQLIHSSARLLSILVVIVGFVPLLVPIMIVSLIPGLITEQRLSKLQWALWNKQGDKARFAWRTTFFLQDKNKLQETKVFGTSNYLLNYLRRLYSEFYAEQLQNLKNSQKPALFSIFSEVIVIIGINIWLLQKVIYHGFSIASFSFYSGVIAQFGSSLGLIVTSLARLYDDNEFMRDFYKVLELKPSLKRNDNPAVIPADKTPKVEFVDVSFKYPGSEKWALQNFSFTLNPGDKVAFVGENGAGKTTIVKLLLRFYDPTNGKILINDEDIRDIDLESYYQHIGALFQNFNDYPYSVRDNIALGRVEHFTDTDRVKKAAKDADAHKFIQNYPKKYAQLLEVGFKDGVEPSGGHWQRIALARALFREAGILILDEPTAAVDAKSEYAIFKTLESHNKGRSTIVISHRFSTVRTADKIYVIDNGKLVESGSHEKLISIKNGLYKDMFEKQARGYR